MFRISPFVAEPYGDSIVGEGPKILSQSVVKFPFPFGHQELYDLVAAM